MKMKIVGEKFYVIELGEDKWIIDTMEEGIETLKKEVLENDDVTPDNARVIVVDTSTEKWNLKMVPWAEIAIGLIRGEKSESKEDKS